ncbi:MAG: tripartite tricarboxylate transporter substrate binding protein [Acetobacteraceae bacterium]|nr:tripartite tricarboxylate transporter substrate binding protein [Acetobacteraceae bacterium]
MRRLLLAALFAVLALPAAAQDWPLRPVRLIVPFPPGGGTDVVSRIVAQQLGQAINQPVVVENRGGAGGAIGSDAVAKAAPDGYTIGTATSSTHPAAVVLRRDVPYDPVRDFAPITMIGVTPYVLVGGPAARGATLREFLDDARSRPGQVTYASVGTSTLGYLLTRQLESLTGTRMTHVPYRGSAAVYPDLLNGTVAVLLDNPTGSAGLVRDGRLRAFAITRRSPLLPEVPSFADAGVPGFEAVFWYGLVAPAGTPPAVVQRIQSVLARHFLGPGRAELAAKDVEPVMDAPADFARRIAADVTAFRATAERLGLQPE